MRFLFVALSMLCLSLTAQAEEKRIALLIGNNDYPASVGRLANTHNDVSKLKASLQATGFEVITGLDQNKLSMLTAIDNFNARVNSEAALGKQVVAFFYYSGHGVSLNRDGQRRNYLLPAKENITSSLTLTDRGIDLSNVISTFAASKAKAFFVISDACRNELEVSFTRSVGGGGKGFGTIPQRPGMLIAFSTAAGATAPDDGKFAEILATQIKTPGKRAAVTFLDAVAEISTYRGLNDQPFLSAGRLPNSLCFAGCQLGDEDRYWQNMQELNVVSGYELYLKKYPNGRYVADAKAAIGRLRVSPSPTPTPSPSPKMAEDACGDLNDDDCFKRALFYVSGSNGYVKNIPKAKAFSLAACDRNLAIACNYLANLHRQDTELFRKNFHEATKYYKKGCIVGYSVSCGMLGDMVYRGIGADKNTSQGEQLLRNACSEGHSWSCNKMKELGISP